MYPTNYIQHGKGWLSSSKASPKFVGNPNEPILIGSSMMIVGKVLFSSNNLVNVMTFEQCNVVNVITYEWNYISYIDLVGPNISNITTNVIRFGVNVITFKPLQWRHNEFDGISNHRPLGCLISHLFRGRSKKTSKLHITGLYEGNSQVTSKVVFFSIWWCHHDLVGFLSGLTDTITTLTLQRC